MHSGLIHKIIDNYFWVFVIFSLWSFVGLRDITSIYILASSVAILSLVNKMKTRINIMDILIVIFISYQILSLFFSSYPLSLWYYGIKSQVVPILFYFVGRSMMFSNNEFLNRMYKPILFSMVVGLILYIWEPSWYIQRRTMDLSNDFSTNAYYERTRLSSIWSWSYTMGFASLIFIMYFIKDLLKRRVKLITYIAMSVAILVLFFAQQRVSIFMLPIFLFMVAFYGNYEDKRKLKYLWLFILILVLGITSYLLYYADSAFVDYVFNRTIDSDKNIIEQRIDMFSSYWKVSALGDGLGKFGHAALIYKMPSISDCEYIRLMAELGVCGCVLLGSIFLLSLCRSYRYIKFFLFEFSVLGFYLAAMIGATPLENGSMFPLVLWYCIGRIYNKKLLFHQRLERNESEYLCR